MSSGNSIGIGWSPSNQLNGERDSSWTAYIRPNMARPNFDVLINTYVTKVVQTGSEGGLPVFRGVEFAQSADSEHFRRLSEASMSVLMPLSYNIRSQRNA